jgi:hypothetical protein
LVVVRVEIFGGESLAAPWALQATPLQARRHADTPLRGNADKPTRRYAATPISRHADTVPFA